MRKETKYNKVVNIAEDGEITVLDYIFFDTLHNKPFNGATGNTFYPISKAEYEERTTRENVMQYLDDSGIGAKQAFDILENGDYREIMFDTSYKELWDYLREECKLDDDSAYIFECTGGGRCFDKDFQGNINPELSELIRKAEAL